MDYRCQSEAGLVSFSLARQINIDKYFFLLDLAGVVSV